MNHRRERRVPARIGGRRPMSSLLSAQEQWCWRLVAGWSGSRVVRSSRGVVRSDRGLDDCTRPRDWCAASGGSRWLSMRSAGEVIARVVD